MVKEEKHINWCEQSRFFGANIFVKNLAIITSSYCYNAVIKRVWKITGAVEQMSLNGGQIVDVANLNNKTLYTSPYMVITDQEHAKHYYAESQRLASKIGAGFALQHLQYLPLRQAKGCAFSESFVAQTSTSWESRYTISGKE